MISEQKVKSVSIKKLKNINHLEGLSFEGKALTAILGANGCGKSTILHALACCYKPINEGKNHIFSHYFTPTTDASWQGSNFTLNHSYRNGKDGCIEVNQNFSKQSDRWSPKYERRIERHVEFIGIKSCVPKIEDETQTSLIRYDTISILSETATKILTSLGVIFNRNYAELNQHNSGKKQYSGLKLDGKRYSSLSMGAGEQRVLAILNKVFFAPKYSLILIDEIDLLLHTLALRRLLFELNKRASDKNLQIIFTTHREAVIDWGEIVNIRHIYQTPDKTYVFEDTKPDALQRLTGNQLRPLDIFVEDNFSKAIVEKVAAMIGLRKYVSVTTFGAATNCFVLASGLAMKDESFDNKLFVLDGDVYETSEKKNAAINKVYSGTETDSGVRKEIILNGIRQYNSVNFKSPEESIHEMLISINAKDLNDEGAEIVNVAKRVVSVSDQHDLINEVNKQMGYGLTEGIGKIIDVASKSNFWGNYVSSIHEWFSERRSIVLESLE